ncbi:MAG: hypothetical protein AVDCRST_MAG31-1713, partial [uncultured Sphingomonas sp.]
ETACSCRDHAVGAGRSKCRGRPQEGSGARTCARAYSGGAERPRRGLLLPSWRRADLVPQCGQPGRRGQAPRTAPPGARRGAGDRTPARGPGRGGHAARRHQQCAGRHPCGRAARQQCLGGLCAAAEEGAGRHAVRLPAAGAPGFPSGPDPADRRGGAQPVAAPRPGGNAQRHLRPAARCGLGWFPGQPGVGRRRAAAGQPGTGSGPPVGRPLHPGQRRQCPADHVRQRSAGRQHEGGGRQAGVADAHDRQHDLLHDLQPLLERAGQPHPQERGAQGAEEWRDLPEEPGFRGHVRLDGERHGGAGLLRRLGGGGVRSQADSRAPAARSDQFDGPDEVQLPQLGGHLPPRHAAEGVFRQVGADLVQRLHPAGGRQAARPLAAAGRARPAHASAGAARQAAAGRAGLRHLPHGAAGGRQADLPHRSLRLGRPAGPAGRGLDAGGAAGVV